MVQNLFYQTLECAGPKKKFFEDSTLKAQNSIANFDIKANKARHPLASTRFFTEFLEFRDKRERKKTRRDGVVLSKEKGFRVETRVDRPDRGLHVSSSVPVASHFWHCHFPIMALPLHWLQGPVAPLCSQPPNIPFPVAYPPDLIHGFIFYRLAALLSTQRFAAWFSSTFHELLPLGYCCFRGAASNVAFLSIFVSFQVVWTSSGVALICK